MKKYLMICLMLCLPSLASAAADIKVSITAEKEVVVMELGKEVKKIVTAKETVPGETIIFTLHFENKGDEVAKDVKLVDPIPEGMEYINGSVFGPGSEITFSIDQGKTYKKPSLLTYEVDGKKRVASPELYSHIQWVVKELSAGKSASAGFKARVK